MNLAPRLIGLGHNFVFMRVLEHAFKFRIAQRPVNRLQQIALDNGNAATGLIESFTDSVADDAGDAFARCRVAFQIRNLGRLALRHADLIVTTDTKITLGAANLGVDEIL